jgi:hypothetical protein
MFSVLVEVLCRDHIDILSFSASELQISLIALLHVVKPLGSDRDEADPQRLGRAVFSVLDLNWPVVANGLWLFRILALGRTRAFSALLSGFYRKITNSSAMSKTIPF